MAGDPLRVKICGLTNLDDAGCAVEAGADLLGFIFYPQSPRCVTAAAVRGIVEALGAARGAPRAVRTVGVFVNEAPEAILRTLEAAGVDYAQLSGDEPAGHVQALAGRGYKAVRRVQPGDDWRCLVRPPTPAADLPDLLLDADHPTLYGGSGARADESLAARLARDCRLLLAGGLTPDNVAGAVRAARPWGVDVSSGVEASPGRKDQARLRAFIAAARQA